jgi:bifunctional non-homologous end joining protein LigD
MLVTARPKSIVEPCLLDAHIQPMLAVSGSMPRDAEHWAFEFKWDGIRALCYWDGVHMRLENRNLRDITPQYPDLIADASQIGQEPVILDGEIVAIDQGRTSFARLQRRMHLSPAMGRIRARAVPVRYFVFDVLWQGRQALLDAPYASRREVLEAIELAHPRWHVPPVRLGQGPAMLEIARQRHLEGLIAKRPQSPYRPGQRSPDWIKIKIIGRQEFVIGGWEPRRKPRKPLERKTRDELRNRASELGVAGRSRLAKRRLVRAIRER